MDLAILAERFLALLFHPWLGEGISWIASPTNSTALTLAKRVLLLLPALAAIWGFWMTLLSALSLIVRSERVKYIHQLMATWWDLGHAVLLFWSGFLKFAVRLVFTITLMFRFTAIALGFLIRDLLMIPITVASQVGNTVVNRGVPWIAVILSLSWCVFEAILFTYVMTPLVLDTLSNMTGAALTAGMVRLPLFFFMLFVVLGSYSVLSTWTQALYTKNVPQIIKIGAIEAVAMFVEVVFLYREFVDALVPWFAQHSNGFELGIFGTLLIAGITWFGIRALSWFLFAAAGTPVIMAIIHGSGVKVSPTQAGASSQVSWDLLNGFMAKIKGDEVWLRAQLDELISSFVFPPLQVAAAAVNFSSLLLSGQPIFDLPYSNLSELKDARMMIQHRKEVA